MSEAKYSGRVAITILDLGYDYADEIAELEKLGFDAAYIPLQGTKDIRQIAASLQGFDYVMIGPETWSEETLHLLPNVKMLARLGVGMDSVDIHAATVRGIPVTNAPGANACSVAQYALAFMMDLATRMTAYDRAVRKGDIFRHGASDIIGSTVGLMGFGNIPKQLARLLSGFEVHILAYARHFDGEAAETLGVSYATPEEIAGQADFVSLHVPLSDSTKGMIGRDFFARMKPSAYIINTSRAEVIDQDSLVWALAQKQIAGAGLDVVQGIDSMPEHPLAKFENVVMTPYVAYSSRLGSRRVVQAAIKSLREFVSGAGEISNLLNPDYIKYVK